MSEEKTIRILPHGKVVAFGVKDNVTRDVAGRLSENDVALEKALQKVLNDLNTALPRKHDDGTWHVGTSDTDVTIMGPQGEKGDTGPAGAAGAAGADGADGADGEDGADGQGVPTGGTTGQALVKASDIDYDTEWADQSGGGVADGTVNGQLLQWNSTSGAWETVLPTQVTVVTAWRLDKTNHKFQVKTRTGYVLSPGAETDWTDISDANGGILDAGVSA